MEHVQKIGVVALKCTVCGKIVGTINANAANIMKTQDDIYICEQCKKLPESSIVFILETHVDIYDGAAGA